MDRRDSLKSLLVGSVAGGLLVTGCAPGADTPEVQAGAVQDLPGYGRNEKEKEHDAYYMGRVAKVTTSRLKIDLRDFFPEVNQFPEGIRRYYGDS